MQTKLISAAALLLAATLSHAADGKKATASIPDNTPILMQAEVGSLDKRVEVAYVCDSQQGKRNVNAMYGIKDGETAVVQIKVGDQVTPGLWRVMNDTNGKKQNSYYGEGLTWITDKASPDTLTKANGKILMQASKLDGGLPKGDQTILFKDCKVDSAATKKLNK
ncbi:hypothetical protein NELON_07885 [Neisseria elongata subsp. glycolytica ATCC 29315]|uniref:Uncharacterized protein n=1 Tax=Neisseria elongata subsp. glycolytica ATCC 29315 TaxID=546263 RepID=D4DUQ8_NEIEG|nr:hypothetical protein [Neisseria elongata]AJE18818.1 hypothetical protein NELON_07885 [Neisseria elongata subsp. glycolytica ATCC 29315]EFE48496.1 hypothetical protein NEIELOOT_02853 [Neisseria elongata subsp. glycolytica ATCC 29315]SQH50709.1 Uncharacterised protein [Neisseria elongata subsp. glycolytica]